MCKVVAYLVTDVISLINLSLYHINFNAILYSHRTCNYIPLIYRIDLTASILPSLSGSIVSPTPPVIIHNQLYFLCGNRI